MRKVPKILQEEMMDCGTACLYAILKYYHGNIHYEKLKKMTNIKGNGTTAFHLLKAGEQLGFLTEGAKGKLEDIPFSNYPCIAHIKRENYYHFVVLMGVDQQQQLVFLMDPSKGYDKVSFSLWEAVCTGNYLFFKVGRPLIKEKPLRFWPFFLRLLPIKRNLVILCISQSVFLFLSLICLLETKMYFSYLFSYQDNSNNLYFFLFFLGFHLLIEWGSSLVQWFFFKLQNKTFYQVEKQYQKLLLFLPYDFFQTHQNSELLEMTQLLTSIVSYCLECFRCLFLDIPIILLTSYYFIRYAPFFFLELSVSFLLFLPLSFLNHKRVEKFLQKYLVAKERKDTLFLNALGRLDVLKGLHQETYFQKRLRKATYSYYDANYSMETLLYQNTIVQKIWKLVMKSLFLFSFLRAFYQKKVSLYSYFFLDLLFQLYLESILRVFQLCCLFSKVRVEGRKIAAVFMTCQEQFPKKSLLPFPKITHLEVKHLSCQKGRKQLFSQLSFQVQEKEHLLIHGKSGSGKSTLLKYLSGYYYLAKGQIYYNGLDIVYMHLEDIRSRVCYVSQEEGLIEGTILENITLGKRMKEEVLQSVLQLTHVDKILEEKKINLDYPVSCLLLPLSGGEKKKILLARALLLKRDVYLFDEVFESIEEEEAMILIQNVLSYLKEKIVLVISHRRGIDDLFHRVIELKEEA